MEKLISNLGAEGINTDLSPIALPLNAWTEIQNGRCDAAGIGPSMPWQLWNGAVPNTNGTWLLFARRSQVPYFFIAGTNEVYLWDGTSYIQVNQTIPNAPLAGRWSGVFDGDIPYLNHYGDAPQYADFPDPNYFASPQLKDVQYDPNGSPGSQTFRELGYRVKVLRSHKGFLFAGGWLRGAQERPSLLAWDDPTAANVPSSNWVPGPTTLAGEYDCVDSGVGDNSGDIVDMVPLRDDLVIYKERSAWIARQTGTTAPAWGIKKLIGIEGLIALDCVASVKGSHFVWGPEDIYVHQGQTAQSIINNRVRRSFLQQIDPVNYINCFVVKDIESKKIMFCGPTQGHTYPNRCLSYHWVDSTFEVHDLPEAAFIVPGTRIEPALTWGQGSMSWGQANFPWGARNFSPLDRALIGIQGTQKKLLHFNIGTDREGTAYFTRFERQGAALDGLRRQNTLKRLMITSTGSGTLQVYAGAQGRAGGNITWQGPRNFRIGVDREVKFRSKGRLNCWRIEGSTGTDWQISDMQIVYEPSGNR